MSRIADSVTRRRFLTAAAAATCTRSAFADQPSQNKRARIAITLDLEMSRHYPRRGMTQWDYEKGNLDEATKQYSVAAAKLVQEYGGRIHFFCVGRTLEQPDVAWLKQIVAVGHSVGNHTYDHVNLKAREAVETQFRFRRSPWLVEGMSAAEVIRQNIRQTNLAMRQRLGIKPAGFRTPGGFAEGLADRPDLQQMLLELGFTWVSSKYPRHASGNEGEQPSAEVYRSIVAAQREAQPFAYPSGLVEVPMSPISDVNAFRSRRWKLAWFLKAIRLAAEWAIEQGGVFDFLAHPSCLVIEDPQLASIRSMCELVQAAGDRAELANLVTIADDTHDVQ